MADVSARILKQEGVIAGLEKRLANKAYVSGAPSHVVSETRASLAAAVELLTNLQRERDRFADFIKFCWLARETLYLCVIVYKR